MHVQRASPVELIVSTISFLWRARVNNFLRGYNQHTSAAGTRLVSASPREALPRQSKARENEGRRPGSRDRKSRRCAEVCAATGRWPIVPMRRLSSAESNTGACFAAGLRTAA